MLGYLSYIWSLLWLFSGDFLTIYVRFWRIRAFTIRFRDWKNFLTKEKKIKINKRKGITIKNGQHQLPTAQPIIKVVDEDDMLVGDYLIPTPVHTLSPANFHLQPNVINKFQNHQDIRFNNKLNENPHDHVLGFLELWEVISHEGTLVDAFWMCLFSQTQRIENDNGCIHFCRESYLVMTWCINSCWNSFRHLELTKSEMR